MTPSEAMTEIEKAIGALSTVRAWLYRHEMRTPDLSRDAVRSLVLCQCAGWQAGEDLVRLHSDIGRMNLAEFGANF